MASFGSRVCEVNCVDAMSNEAGKPGDEASSTYM